MEKFTEKYKKLFLQEATEKIIQLNSALLALEKDSNNINKANEAMRASHTLKSSSAAMRFTHMSSLAHAMEDLFEQVRTNKHTLNSSAINTLFLCADALENATRLIQDNHKEPETKSLEESIRNISKSISNSPSKEQNQGAELAKRPEDIRPIESIKVDVSVLDRLMNLSEELLVERMRLGEIVRTMEKEDSSGMPVWQVSKSEINEQHQQVAYPNNERIKSKSVANVKLYADIKQSFESFNRLLEELQYNVVESRMIPLGQLFERFPRMVRDLAQEEKKQIEFEISGQDIELDRTIIDRLGEPLVHLLRNAVDHGISAKQKGVISLKAQREQDKVIVEVTDTGTGIKWQEVVHSALTKGIIDKTKAQKYSDFKSEQNTPVPIELEELIFHPQLSTKQQVTETSGRGIGLSIVRSAIESLGGSVSVSSSSSGTTFSMSLPLTLAIIQALLVKVAGQVYALPFSQIDRSVRVAKRDIKKAFDQEIAVVNNEDIPMVRLSALFNLRTQTQVSNSLFLSDEELNNPRRGHNEELMIVAKTQERQAGIIVDELVSEQDIVVKPLKGALKQTKGFAGITLLGDGSPALILDLSNLF
jgi:two-component system, chemotaxis family, sensor kinase CheA